MAKAKKMRVKQPAIIAAQTKEDVAGLIREIGDLSRDVKAMEVNMNDGIAALQQEYADNAAPLNERIEALQQAVQVWCEANRDALTDNGKVKYADLVTGVVKWRFNPPSVKVTGKDAVIALLEQDEAMALQFVSVKKDVNRNAVLSNLEQFIAGQVPGIKIVQGNEYFVIEPHNQELGCA